MCVRAHGHKGILLTTCMRRYGLSSVWEDGRGSGAGVGGGKEGEGGRDKMYKHIVGGAPRGVVY